MKQLTRLVMITALATTLRLGFSGLPNIQPITALFLAWVLYFGLGEASMLMALTMLVTSFFLGFGPWVLFQIVSFAIVLCLWNCLVSLLPKAASWQMVLAGLMAFVYGFMIDGLTAFLYGSPVLITMLNGLSFNMLHSLSTFLFYPMIKMMLRRYLHDPKKICD